MWPSTGSLHYDDILCQALALSSGLELHVHGLVHRLLELVCRHVDLVHCLLSPAFLQVLRPLVTQLLVKLQELLEGHFDIMWSRRHARIELLLVLHQHALRALDALIGRKLLDLLVLVLLLIPLRVLLLIPYF